MGTAESEIELADRLSRRRARMFAVVAVLVLFQQFEFFRDGAGERTVDHVRFGAWVVMAGFATLAITTGGMLLRARHLRALVNDAPSRLNRASALAFGFVAAMVVGIALYPFADWLDLTVREALRLVVTAGLVAALLRFAMLERRELG
jgi:hypothetical protein